MENFKVVRPGHLNHYDYLFGGELLKWVDEISWIAASCDYPGCKFVTVRSHSSISSRVTTRSLINHRGHRAHRDGKRFIDGEDYRLCH